MNSDLQSRIRKHLGQTETSPGILHRHGRVLMSGWDTIQPDGRYYVAATNPGGKEVEHPPRDETIEASLDQHTAGWNYFSTNEAGDHATRVLPVFTKLAADPQRTLTTNALFLRSAAESSLPADASKVFQAHCAPVHAEMLSIVNPKVIVCFGNHSWTYLIGRTTPDHYRFNPDVTFNICGKEFRCGVLLLPHFARQALKSWENHAADLDQAQIDANAYAHA